jgi:type II secretory pathway pseudopilin PulG
MRQIGRTRASFTFIEIMVAVLILGVSLIMTLNLIAQSRSRLLRAEEQWANRHLLNLATEYYLLAGPNATLPGYFLERSYSASCEVREVDPGLLPEHAHEMGTDWKLYQFTVSLYLNGELIDQQTVEKACHEEKF